ncbi:TPA: hypothetical protein N0F65_009041 [Lagenidium giganteum]|uniref:5-formyltetrahydrofolate cyclo-ligase n=1 Tax=Lagenidium giganteum TaxID=4803 RepID=A0AAV2YWT1_9STRA|nr:TPA: hypothetical protein N0F65_009041 [Lagenidium giganteum]
MTDMTAVKKELRKQIATRLKQADLRDLAEQSQCLTERICALPEFQSARAVSVYLEMPREAATRGLLTRAFELRKEVYVPKIVGRSAEDMKMVHALSLEDVDAFPKDKWQIPDPPNAYADGKERQDPMLTADLDLILMPGVAFDRQGGRLGHGKGYYDSFLRRLSERHTAENRPMPRTVGLCLADQLVDQVPLSPHDRLLDVIVTPEETIRDRAQPSPPTMRQHAVRFLLVLCLFVSAVAGRDLYELLGVSSSSSESEMKRAYRKLSLKYHPDKQAADVREKMKEEFVQITNAYRVLSDPDRRRKYDLYGIADEQGFKNFDEAFRFAHDSVDADSVWSWLGLLAVVAAGVLPIVIMQRNRTKPVKKRREALLSLSRNKLTTKSAQPFNREFTYKRRQYINNPAIACTQCALSVAT